MLTTRKAWPKRGHIALATTGIVGFAGIIGSIRWCQRILQEEGNKEANRARGRGARQARANVTEFTITVQNKNELDVITASVLQVSDDRSVTSDMKEGPPEISCIPFGATAPIHVAGSESWKHIRELPFPLRMSYKFRLRSPPPP